MRALSRTRLSWVACWLASCAVLVIAGTAQGEEDGLALLVNAVKHSGDRQIQSGEFVYTQHIVTDPPSPERIKQMVEQSRASMQRTLDAAGANGTARKRLQKALVETEKSITTQMKRNADRRWQYRFALRTSDDHAERSAEFVPIDTEPNRDNEIHIVLLRPELAIAYQFGTLTNITTTGVYFSQEPQHLGRLMGIIAERLAGKNETFVSILRDTVTAIEVEKLDGDQQGNIRKLSCHFEAPGTPPTQIVMHVDPSRGYVTPLVRESDEDGDTLREWVAGDYFQPAGSVLWFPRSITYRHFAKRFGQNRTEHYEFTASDVALNKPMPDERFTIVLQQDSTLRDYRNQANISYKVKDECRLSLDAVEKLEAIPELERR
jgi:hypothetical protein